MLRNADVPIEKYELYPSENILANIDTDIDQVQRLYVTIMRRLDQEKIPQIHDFHASLPTINEINQLDLGVAANLTNLERLCQKIDNFLQELDRFIYAYVRKSTQHWINNKDSALVSESIRDYLHSDALKPILDLLKHCEKLLERFDLNEIPEVSLTVTEEASQVAGDLFDVPYDKVSRFTRKGVFNAIKLGEINFGPIR